MSTSKDAAKIVYGTDTEQDIGTPLTADPVQVDTTKQPKKFSLACKVVTAVAAALALAGAGAAVYFTHDAPEKTYTVKKFTSQAQSGPQQLWTAGYADTCSQNFYSAKTNTPPTPMPHQLILCQAEQNQQVFESSQCNENYMIISLYNWKT